MREDDLMGKISEFNLRFLFFTLFVWMMGCSSAPQASELPSWVLKTPRGCGMGSVRLSGSISLAKTGAIARGRDSLGRELQTEVESVIRAYRREGGKEANDLTEEMMVDSSRQSSHALLQGTREREMFISQSQPQTIYTLVCFEPSRRPSLVKSLSLIPKRHRAKIRERAKVAFDELESLMKSYDE